MYIHVLRNEKCAVISVQVTGLSKLGSRFDRTEDISLIANYNIHECLFL